LINCASKDLLGLGGARSEQLANRLKAEQESLEALQQRVVQIARDAGALSDALLQACVECMRDLPQAQLIECPKQCCKSHYACRTEPVRLVPGRRDYELQRSALLVPDTAVIAGNDAEAVIARSEVSVLNMTLVDHFPPALVLALQHDAKFHVPRHHQAKCGVINQQITDVRRQAQTRPRFIRDAIPGNLLNVDWRRERVKSYSGRIDKAHLYPIYKPDSPVGRLRDRGPEALKDRYQPNSILNAEPSRPNGSLRIGDPGVHVGSSDT
jgi:hypothetical protein